MIKDGTCQDVQAEQAEGDAQVNLLQRRAALSQISDVLIAESDRTLQNNSGKVFSVHLQGEGPDASHDSRHSQMQVNSVGSLRSFLSKDDKGKVCIMCGKPLPERMDSKSYKHLRTDCGNHSSNMGPSKEALHTPIVQMYRSLKVNAKASNGFCELNFAKSCADAIVNEDYLYWAKSLDLRKTNNRAWEAHYCRRNGFLEPRIAALQHSFTGMKQRGQEFCKTKYAKYGFDNMTFLDMMAASKSDSPESPSLAEAERLAAWNCAMGDLGCDMALCAYSFCDLGEGKVGLYDECPGWHPVTGMSITSVVTHHGVA